MSVSGGAQPERTALAWERTVLALLVNGALLLVRDVRSAGSLAVAAAALALLAALVVAVLGARRTRALRAGRPSPARTPLLVTGVAVVAVGVAVSAVLLLGRH